MINIIIIGTFEIIQIPLIKTHASFHCCAIRFPFLAPMTAVEAEQEDHVELDYGDGDMDETNVEDEPKKSDNKELVRF